jgi:hypothetical protein
MRKHPLRVLGALFLTTLGLIAAGPANSQAEGGVKIEGSGPLATGKTFTAGTPDGHIRLIVPILVLEIDCPKFSVTEGKILSGLEGKVLVEYLLEECTTAEERTEKEVEEGKEGKKLPCKIAKGEENAAGHITMIAIFLAILHNGATYLLGSADVLSKLASIKYEGAECPLKEKEVNITGNPVFEVAQGDINRDGEKVEPLIKASKAIQQLFEPTDRLRYGANTAYFVGSMRWKLTGTHAGLKWGFV